MKICIDQGHYGSYYNVGVAAGYVESNFTWTYSQLLKERLEKYGVDVLLTRSNKEEDMGLQARGQMAVGRDLFISVHSNATDSNPHMNAMFTHWSVRSGGEGIAKKIGYGLTEFFKKEWGWIDDPVMYEWESTKHPGYDYLGVLKGAASVNVPGIVVEHSFHTNKKYCEWAMTPGNLERMADEEVRLIAEYYGLVKQGDHAYCIPLYVNLKKGDKGEEVKRLQARLRQVSVEFDEEVEAHSYKNGEPDGSFGGSMVNTIKKLQSNAGIVVSGELDDATRSVLNSDIGVVNGELTSTLSQLQDSNEKIKSARQALL